MVGENVVGIVDGFVVDGGEGLECAPWVCSKAELVGEVHCEGVCEGLLYVTSD